MNQSSSSKTELRPLAMRLFLGSISISATMAIILLIFGEFGELEIRVLLTTLTVSAGSICAMASAAQLDQGSSAKIARIGFYTAVAATVFSFMAIWMSFLNVLDGKVIVSLWIIAATSAHASLINGYGSRDSRQWLILVARISAGVTSLILLMQVWMHDAIGDLSGLWRLLGSASVALVASTLALAILNRAGGNSSPAITEEAVASRPSAGIPGAILCPHCGGQVIVPES